MKNNFSKLLIISLISMFLLVMLFAGCTAKSTTETTAAGTTETTKGAETTAAAETKAGEVVKINVPVIAGWVTTDSLIPVFKEKLAGEGVEVVTVEGDNNTMKNMEMMAGSGKTGEFDLMIAWEALQPLMVQYLEPLDDLLVKAGVNLDEFKKKFYPSVIDQVTYDGKIYFIPIHVNSQLGYARADLITNPDNQVAFKAEFGYDMPQPNELGGITFKDKAQFLDVAKFFTKGDVWGYAPAGKGDHGECIFLELLLRAGLEYFDPQGHSLWGPTHPENQKTVQDLATWMQDLVLKDKVVSPGTIGMEMTEVNQLYKEGKAAMSFTWNVDYWTENNKPEVMKNWNNTKPLSWSIDFMNTAPENKGVMSIIGYGISKDSKNKDAAVKFLLTCLDNELRQKVHSTVGLPCGNGQIELTDWIVKNNYAPASYADAINSVGSCWPISKTPWKEMESARQVARTNLEELLSGSITPEQFVKITGDGVEKIMKEAGYF